MEASTALLNNEDPLTHVLQTLELATADGNYSMAQQSALQLLQLLQSTPTLPFLAEVGAKGGCAAVCTALRGVLQSDSWTCVDALLQCVRWLCAYGEAFDTRVDANLTRFRNCECNQLLVDILREGGRYPNILRYACIYVWQLVRQNENKALLGRSGACEAVVQAMPDTWRFRGWCKCHTQPFRVYHPTRLRLPTHRSALES